MDRKAKHKIMTGFCIFLGLMWLCTVISKGIYTSQLPIVSTESVQQKYIEHIVEAEGIVVAGNEIPVTTLSGLRVDKLMVQPGDLVQEGDVILTVDMEDLDDIIAGKQAQIDKLQLQISTYVQNEEIERQERALEEQRAREDYDETARRENTMVERAFDEVNKAENKMNERSEEASEEELREELQRAAYAEADAKWQRDNAIKEAARKVEDVTAPESGDATLEIDRLELTGLQEELSRFQKIKDAGGQIKAGRTGTVTAVCVSVGARTSDSAVMLLSDDSVPCRFKAVITGDQKKYVGLHDEISLELDGSREEKATVNYMAEDSSGAGSYELYVDLPERTGTPGQTGTLTRTESGERQPCCVTPLAVQEENARNFVYVVKEREGILGKEYYAEQVVVRIVDKNDSFVALDAALDSESLIISSSTRDFKNGDVVRLSEE